MAGVLKIIKTEKFTNSNSVIITHNAGQRVSLRLIINGTVQNELIQSVTLDPVDPDNKLTATLSSTQSGTIQVFADDSMSDVILAIESKGGDETDHYHSEDRNRSNHTGTQPSVTISDFDSSVDSRISSAAGTSIASLVSGKIPVSQLPDSVTGSLNYQGLWNANTNSPTITGGSGTKNHYYKVSVTGTTNIDGITDWAVGDWIIYNGTAWEKLDNSDAVSTVNGQAGIVVLDTDDISEGSTNLYYTEARVNNNTNVAANTAHKNTTGNPHSATTTDVPEGTNLYYTEARVNNNTNVAANTAHRNSTGNPHSATTTDVPEGTNLYYTETRVNNNTNVAANSAHRVNTSNPHSVTKSQVGLGNVTDDAQLKRAAGDFGTFAEKTSLNNADVFLIEDSASSNNKKKIQASNIFPIFGTQYNYIEDESVTTTTSTNYVQKLRLNITGIPAGNYRIGWNYSWNFNATYSDFESRVQLNDSIDLVLQQQEPKDSSGTFGSTGTDQKYQVCGFNRVTLGSGNHFIDIDWRSGNGSEASIWNARIEFWRVP